MLTELDAAPSSALVPISSGLGIDIECADNLPWSGDPWTEAFYVENFTAPEIAHCLRQPDPRLSFCGLWCAKEAALKCGPAFAGLRPIDLEVHHNAIGRPSLRKAGASASAGNLDCAVSISHAGRTCIAICLLPRV